MTSFLILFSLLVAPFFLALRNESTHRARQAFLDAGGFFDGTYHALPGYFEMALSPKYWLLWSEADWRAWVARKQQKVSA